MREHLLSPEESWILRKWSHFGTEEIVFWEKEYSDVDYDIREDISEEVGDLRWVAEDKKETEFQT